MSAPGSGNRRKGFTLIELLVVCAIIIVITAIVLIDSNKFGGDVTLENFAYDVALSLRQTQVYGIAVEQFGSSNFSVGYGMYFAQSSPTQYILFADEKQPPTGIYDSSVTPSEAVSSNTIQQGYSISRLCVVSYTSQNCQQVSEIDILYIRPEPRAYISAGGDGVVGDSYSMASNSCYQNLQNCYYEAQITLISPKGDTRTVAADATGQISVQLQ